MATLVTVSRKTQSPFRTPEFLELQKEWYGKLAASGFRDIEVNDEEGLETGYLRGMSTGDLQRGLYQAGTVEYYNQARAHMHRIDKWLHTAKYRGYDDDYLAEMRARRDVWSYHCEGLGAETAALRLGLGVNRVRRMIAQERERMLKAENKDDV